MVYDQSNFISRLNRLIRKHHAMSQGYRAELAQDGLVVFKPKRRTFGASDMTGTVPQLGRKAGLFRSRGAGVPGRSGASRARLSPRGVLMFIAGYIAFKGFLMFHFGPAGYEERIAGLSGGNPVEQVGAWIMQIDPVTLFLFEQAQYFLV